MHSPIAIELIRPHRGDFPGVCRWTGSEEVHDGYSVPYRRLEPNGSLEQWVAVVNILVLESSRLSSYPDFIPFVIDTGFPVTVLPRKLLRPEAFPLGTPAPPAKVVIPSTGKGVVGHTFSASLFMGLPESAPLSFGSLTVLVVDFWEGEYAVLGLDALRRVPVLLDNETMTFWLPQGRPLQDDDEFLLKYKPRLPLPEAVRRAANLYTIAKLGDALVPALEGNVSTWSVEVHHRRTRELRGKLLISHDGEKVEWQRMA